MTSLFVSVRPALIEDLTFFASVEARAAERFNGQDLPIALRENVTPMHTLEDSQRDGLAWAAVDPAGQVVGFLVAGKVPSGIYIHEMSVLPSHGGLGAGKALLGAATDFARNAGCAQIMLTTFSHLPWNAPFYLRQGFRILSPGEGPPELLAHLADEAAAGLRNRVAMSKDVN